MKPNVLQHQYAVCIKTTTNHVLTTKGIWICTGWYGWDLQNNVYFLCHFDHPCSAYSVPEILERIKKVSPNTKSLHSVLVGGKRWFWSPLTRQAIINQVKNQNELRIKIKHGPYDNCLFSHRNLAVSLTSSKHRYDPGKLKGRSHPDESGWFFGPMRRVETNG